MTAVPWWGICVLVLGSLVVLGSGCSEPDRGEYRDMAAEDVCDEAESCENLGPDGLHDSHSECIIEERKRFNDLWPEGECGQGRIDPDAYHACMDRALNVACDGGGADWLAAIDYCRASRVCVH